MKNLSPLAFIIILQLLLVNPLFAQSIVTLQPPPSNIAIDGNIKEWGDSLRYYNTEKKINFAVANTKDTLYMAIRVNDRSEQTRILKAGLTFSIDPKGKRKDTYSLTFPLNVGGSAPKTDFSNIGDVSPQERAELQKERLTTLRGIKCVGFKDIEDEMITTANTYGIKAAVNYDDNDYLVCEAAIPLSFFHVDDINKNEWAFNFKINGITKPVPTHSGDDDNSASSGGGRGGRGVGGGGMGGGRGGHKSGDQSMNNGLGSSPLFKTEDFWEKFYMAK
jgi:uncharacterized membrane protein YgcG